MRRVYLAGPDVFVPDPADRSRYLKSVLAELGLEGVFPLDAEVSAEDPVLLASRIHGANEALIRSCDAVLANLTPFRGPSADAGTVYEIGYARALGKLIVGYSIGRGLFAERTKRWIESMDGHISHRPDGSWQDGDGMQIEDFGLRDNLMIDRGIHASGGVIVVRESEPERAAAEELAKRLGAGKR